MAKNADINSINTFEIWDNFEFQTKGKGLSIENKRKVAALLKRECCNYDAGNCILLDDGVLHRCPQVSSDVLGCNWFKEAVLPLDHGLEAELAGEAPREMKKCAVCGKSVILNSSRAKYCPKCAEKVHRKQRTESQRGYRLRVDK